MNEGKVSNPHFNSLDMHKEDSEEEYQVIEEDYHSSPKCGIKSRIVKKVTSNIIFTPIEISAKPYFKYCVTQIKEEQKNNNSSNIEKNSNTKNIKIIKNEIKNKKDEVRESVGEEDNKESKETEETNNLHFIEEKTHKIASDMTNKNNEFNKKKEKNINFRSCNNFLNSEKETKKIINIKLKLNLNNEKQQNNCKINNNAENQKMIHSLKVNSNKLIHAVNKKDKDSNNANTIYNLYSLSLKDEKVEERGITPKNLTINGIRDKNEQFGIPSLFTTNNIKRIKKLKKFQDNGINKSKIKVARQHSFIPLSKIKKAKIHIEEKDKENKKIRRHSLIAKDKDNKGNKLYFNILANEDNKINLKKNKSKHQKMKSLGEKTNELLKFEKFNKKYEKESSGTPKRRMICRIKLKMDDSFKDSEHKNSDVPKSSKAKRKASIFDNNTFDNKKKKKIFTEEKKETSLFKNKKSTFSSLKDKDKDKDNKEKKVKIKKTKKIKPKENKDDKDKKNKKDGKTNRKDKSFTIINKMKKNLINDEENKKNNKNNDFLHSSKSTINIIDISRKNSQKSQSKSPNKNNETKQDVNISDVRRNSTRDLVRENKEKITAYTNKQTIENIQEYTRQCLEIIPDLFDLGDKMPRCKTKINPDFSKNKKIALFDLDETIVHCIGEINMNNIESLSRQSDAKIKVHLPGGKREVTIGINIRPHWEEALSKIKKKYHIVAFTASHESYADSVLNYIDPNKKYFEYRLYRAHCVLCVMNEMKFYIKDLKILEDSYDLKDVVIIDNSVLSFAYHLDNGIPISPFYDSKTDTELLDIADFLVKYADENDIRDKLKEEYKLNQYLEILKNYNSDESSGVSIIEEENKDQNKNIPSLGKNKAIIDLKKPLINNTTNKDNDKKDEQIKNISQINLKLKDIKNIFNDNDHKDDKEDSKNKTPNINDAKHIKKIITKTSGEKSAIILKKKKSKEL